MIRIGRAAPLVVATMLLLFFAGCGGKRTSALMPVNGCKPLAPYSTIHIAATDTSTTLITSNVRLNAAATLQGYVNEFNQQLKYKLEGTGRFATVSVGNDCGPQGIKLETKIIAVEQYDKRSKVIIRGSLGQCNTGQVLYRFEQDDRDSSLLRTAEIIASRIVEDMVNQMSCETPTT